MARIIVIGAGIGGLTTAALLAQAGHNVIVLEAQTYAGGSAGTFTHKGYRFDGGATVVGGFQPNGPHFVAGKRLGIQWNVHRHDPAWVVHLPERDIALTGDNADVIANFPNSESFWREQSALADLGWSLSAQGLPFPPMDTAEWLQLGKVGIGNFPRDLRMIPFALMSTSQWIKWRGLAKDRVFTRFIDAQLLISAQTPSHGANAMYAATALDLARQGVYHVEGGIGRLAETLVDALESFGGEIRYRHYAKHIQIEGGRAVGVTVEYGIRGSKTETLPCDFVIGNLTPWSLDDLFGDHSPASLKSEVETRRYGWGAFALHLGVRADMLPSNLPDHHQVIADMDSPLGETKSVFLSMSPKWDTTRAPIGHRAVTMTTHTNVQQWWDLLAQDKEAYAARKADYTERMLDNLERAIPNFKRAIVLTMAGTPVTYQFYTGRHKGMVGGFPQTSLFKARSPRTGIPNVRLVGDSIFPGQSTAGVTLGAMRVADDVLRHLPHPDASPIESEYETESVST